MKLSLIALVLSACAPKSTEPAPAATAPTPPPAPELPAYAKNMLGALDTTTSACTDLYQFACGNWMKETVLPADKASWTRSFSVIRDENLEVNRQVLEAAAKDPGTDPDKQKLGAFYGSCMDEAAVNTAGLTPLAPVITEIDAVKDVGSFMSVAGKLQTYGVAPILQVYTDADYKNPQKTILYLTQGGLSLPDKKYYDRADAKNAALLDGMEKLVASTLVRLGTKDTDAAKQAKGVIALETAIADASLPREDLRDPSKTYHKLDRAGLLKHTPSLKWDKYLAAMGADAVTDINVETPDTFKKIEGILKKTDTATLKAYLKWQLVHGYAGMLDKATYDADFDLFRRQVTGQKEAEQRWKRCVSATDSAMGELLGKAFVEARFAGDSKPIALNMITQIESAFSGGLQSLTWMDETTRGRAVEKMKLIRNKIGYPDQWRDYSTLTLTPGKAAENWMAANAFEHKRQIAKVGKDVDKGEWLMTPAMVNAYYNATANEMAFPAGIMQPPFFSKDFPTAMNYGAIGMVMGHELTHGFDDQGAKFDGQGAMSDWWAPEVVTRFTERTNCVVSQYDSYEPQPGLKVNGKLTAGENIADLGGLRQAYRAYKANAATGKAAAIPGYTDDQVFFLAFAQGWCTVQTPEMEKMRILSDPHSPPKYRVNGPAVNLPEFQAAFNCAPDAPMVAKNRCEVW